MRRPLTNIPLWSFGPAMVCSRRSASAVGLVTLLLTSSGTAQTILSDRPGRWIAIQPSATANLEPVFETDLGLQEVVTLSPLDPVAQTPQPGSDAIEVTVVPDVTPDILEQNLPRVATIRTPNAGAGTRADPLEELTEPTGEPGRIDEPKINDTPSGHVTEVAALAEALAARLAGDAHDIMMAAQLSTPLPDTINQALTAETELATAAELAPIPEALQYLARAAISSAGLPISAVLLPSPTGQVRPIEQPAAFAVPNTDLAPVLPIPLPKGPEAQAQVALVSPSQTVSLSALLVPGMSVTPDLQGQVMFAVMPPLDPFPVSALPPGSLPVGPESLSLVGAPSMPTPEAISAVLIAPDQAAPQPAFASPRPALPAPDETPLDPDVEILLPEAEPRALARVITDAEICWRLANLGAEAQWATLSVEIALDETNMPSFESIRLVGFSGVISTAAAEAYHAARSALVNCAQASGMAPATASATLFFDRGRVSQR